MQNLTFSDILVALKKDAVGIPIKIAQAQRVDKHKLITINLIKVCRSGWNGKGMYISLQMPDLNSKMSLPYIYMKTADDKLVPWLASQTDILAEDWEILS